MWGMPARAGELSQRPWRLDDSHDTIVPTQASVSPLDTTGGHRGPSDLSFHSNVREGQGSGLMALLCNPYCLYRKAGLKQTSCYALHFALKDVSPVLTKGYNKYAGIRASAAPYEASRR